MHYIKHTFFIILLTSSISKEPFAESLNQNDMAYAFCSNCANTSNPDLDGIALLSHQEMMETEGNVAPFLYVGAVRGGYLVGRGLQIYTRYYYGVWAPPIWRYATNRPSHR